MSGPNGDAAAHEWEVFALRYATHEGRSSAENYLGEDPHDGIEMPLDFYIWVLRCGERTILVDTGFTAEMAVRRKRRYLHSPLDLLDTLGVDALRVEDVVITHMHYDHAGNIAAFPNATLHMQEAEMAYCTGRCMCHPVLRKPFEAKDVAQTIERLYAGRVSFVDGDKEIAPGVSVHLLGGHTAGLQVVRVRTRRGWIVLASDAAHYWDNLRSRRPFPIVYDVARMLDAHHRIEHLADGPDHIIPGHDPAVCTRFPAWQGATDIVELHRPPSSPPAAARAADIAVQGSDSVPVMN